MTNSKSPAFPIEELFKEYGEYGLTKREYFAAKALAAIIISDGAQYSFGHESNHARAAYAHADAMIEQGDNHE